MKAKLITYWVVTVVFCGFMAWSAYAYLTRAPKMVEAMTSLGYPDYFLTILGVAKLLGVLALLVPAFPRLKEWAYAGFAFDLIGAVWSHIASGQQNESPMPALFFLLLAVSYFLRPVSLRLVLVDVIALEA